MSDIEEIKRLISEAGAASRNGLASLDKARELIEGLDIPDPSPVQDPEFQRFAEINVGNFMDFGNVNFPDPEQDWTRRIADIDGRKAMRLKIMPGDPQWSNDIRTGVPKRRAELSLNGKNTRFKYGADCWAGMDFFLPAAPMENANGVAITQIHNYPDHGVMFMLNVVGGKLRASCARDKTRKDGTVHFFEADLGDYLDRWVNMKLNFKPTREDDGYIRLMLDGEQVGEFEGWTKKDGDLGPYLKHGLYFWGYERWDNILHAIAYFSDVWAGYKA